MFMRASTRMSYIISQNKNKKQKSKSNSKIPKDESMSRYINGRYS